MAYNDIVTLALTLERNAGDLFAERVYLVHRMDDLEAAAEMSDKLDQAEWWYDAWLTAWPGATQCEHGLSLQLCAGPGHYPPDDYFY